jgi:hypothetical protein
METDADQHPLAAQMDAELGSRHPKRQGTYPIVKGTFALVLYFAHQDDRADMVQACKEIYGEAVIARNL